MEIHKNSLINIGQAFENSTNNVNDSLNCKKLWSSVIEFALADATSRRNKFRDKRLRKEAIDWLLYNNESFIEVCCLADIDPKFIRRKLLAWLTIRSGSSILDHKEINY